MLITDSTAGDSVAFLDSTTKDYASNFTVVLDSGVGGDHVRRDVQLRDEFAERDDGPLDRRQRRGDGNDGQPVVHREFGRGDDGNFVGVDVQGNVTTTSDGAITITGTGGDQVTGSQFGVRVQATVSTGGLGNLTITGTGGASIGGNNPGSSSAGPPGSFPARMASRASAGSAAGRVYFPRITTASSSPTTPRFHPLEPAS